MTLEFAYTLGTHRIATPQATLARIEPHLSQCGITRATEVTGLDCLGVPVFCAIRPGGIVLQVSNGKGLCADSARVSALMEALELYHAEHPAPDRLRRASLRELAATGAQVLLPSALTDGTRYFSREFKLDWVAGESLFDGSPVWAPASLAYFARQPAPLTTDSNGLASGNHVREAALHGIYELLERDALARLSVDGRLQIRNRCRLVDWATIPDTAVRGLAAQIEARETSVRLLWVPSRIAVHTFWVILLNRRAGAAVSTLNLGAGCHRDPLVAAARALTEAAQARLTMIHGAREDRGAKPVAQASRVRESAAYRYFSDLSADTAWCELPGIDVPRVRTLSAAYDALIEQLRAEGQAVFQFDLTRAEIGIPVVKVVAPGLGFNHSLL